MHFAVIGNPITHSKSPDIHQAFASQFGIDLVYEKQLVEIGQFNTAMDDFFNDAVGCNVTVPFKEEAYHYADKLSADAKSAGAVNTLVKTAQGIYGDNTDGIGLVRDLTVNHQCHLVNKKVLIIGAGGAAKGVLLPLLNQQVNTITVANRTLEKAQSLVATFAMPERLSACSFAELKNKSSFDLIINATSASLSGATLPLPKNIFSHDGLAYDMFYADYPTPFMALAKSNGMEAVDGLGMLVEQAAASFLLWHQVMPQTADVIKKIRNTLSKC